MRLTPEQIFLFRHNGFLKLPELLPQETVAALKEMIWKHIQDEIGPVMRDKQGKIVRISAIWERDPLFRQAMTAPQVLDPLESLLGPNIELITNRHNHATLRMAGDSADFPHRDVLQWTRPIVTVIFYLEETTVESGCTLVVPGTQLLPGRPEINMSEDEEMERAGVFEQMVP